MPVPIALSTILPSALALATLLWSAATPRGLDRLTHWRPSSRLTRSVSATAIALTILLVFEEFGLLLEEWHLPTGPLSALRHVMGLPGVTHILYLANLALVAPATATILKEQAPTPATPEAAARQERLHAAFILMFLAIALVLTALQALVWGVFGGTMLSPVGLGVVSLFAVVLLRITAVVGKLQASSEADLAPLDRLHRWHVWLLLLGIALLQTMVTKATLLLLLVPRCKQGIVRLLKRTVPAAADRAPTTVEELAQRVQGAELARVAGFYFLMTSGMSSLLMWQSHAGPFPPSGSAYPMTQTIGTLYTLDIIVMVWAIARTRTSWWAVGSAMALLATTRHLLPLIMPTWFSPSLDPPGFDPVTALGSVFGTPFAAVVVSAVVHLLTFALFFIQHRALTHSDAALVRGQRESLRPLFWWSVGMEACFVAMMLTLTTILFVAQFPIDDELASSTLLAASAITTRLLMHLVLVVAQAIYAIATMLMLGDLYRRGRSQVDQVVGEVRRRTGEAGLGRFYDAVPAARSYGLNRPLAGRDHLMGWYAAAVGLMVVGAVVTLVRG